MKQAEFSEYIVSGLVRQFPQFSTCCTNRPGGIMDIDYKSKAGELTLWLTTQDKEVTIGFSDDAELSNFHTHMSLFGANAPEEELQTAIVFVRDILSGKERITYSASQGYALFDEEDIAHRIEHGEIIAIKLWNEL